MFLAGVLKFGAFFSLAFSKKNVIAVEIAVARDAFSTQDLMKSRAPSDSSILYTERITPVK